MASSYTDLGIEKMATGENAGTWGTKTNTNLDIIEKSIAGYVEQAVTSGGTTALSITDGDATESTSVARHAVIKLTGTITGNSIVTVPDSVEKVYIVTNGTSGAYTVQFKTASGTGITFGVSEKTTRLVYSDGTNLVDAGFGGSLDVEGRELILDADGDTSITADTDDQIDIKIAGADDFQFTANTFTAQSGSTIAAQALTATTVTASGIVKTDDTTEATSTTDGSLQTDGGLSVAKDAVLGDDLKLLSDSAVLSFGADSDTTLTHTDGTGLTLNSTNKLLFRDTGLYINSSTDGQLDIVADTEVQIAATTIDINGAIAMDGAITGATNITLSGELDAATLDISGNADIDGTLETDALSINGTTITTTAAEINLIDGDTARGTTAVADADGILHNDGGTMRMTSAATFKTYFTSGVSSAADDITIGDAAVTLSTSSGNITIDATANDSDIIFKGTDNSSDITMLTLDGSDAGSASFNDKVTIGDGKLVLNSTAVTSTAAELNLLDGVSGLVQADLTKLAAIDSTAAELNIVDGGTSATSTTVADADRVVLNDNGTMVQVAVTDLAAYFDDEITAMPNLVTTAATTVGALNSGSITSGFGTIDTGSSTITTTGLISGGSLDIDNVLINGTTIGHTDDTDLMTVADGVLTVAGELDATTLDISGNADIDGTTNLDAVDIDGAVQLDATLTIGANDQGYDVILYGDTASANLTWDTSVDDLILNGAARIVVPDGQLVLGSTAVSSTAAELNLLDGVSGLVQADLTKLAAVDSTAAELNIVDGGTSATSTTLVDADRLVANDNGTMVQVAMTDVKTYIGGGTSWQAVKTGNFTAAAGQGVFVNTTSAAITITLPAGTIGDEVSIVDYAGTFDSNACTVAANGSEKIFGSTDDLTVSTERAAFTLVFTDSTQGWLFKND